MGGEKGGEEKSEGDGKEAFEVELKEKQTY